MQAVYRKDKDEVKLLLSKGTDPNAFPLMVMVFKNPVSLKTAISMYLCKQVDFSPLMEASRDGNVEMARILLDAGADPNLANNVSAT